MSVRCILCPRGCTLKYECKKGKEFAKEASFQRERVLVTTMECEGGVRVPVRSTKPLPKEMLKDAIEYLHKRRLALPIKKGDVIVKNILSLSVDIIATRSILFKE